MGYDRWGDDIAFCRNVRSQPSRIINMIINIICNRNGFELNSTAQSLWSALIAIELYRSLAKNEADKDSQK